MNTVTVPFFRTGFNYDRDLASEESGLECKDESLTNQSMAEDADINVMVRRFGLTGTMPQGLIPPTYGDFVGITDFRSALHAIKDAEERFMQMPAEVRRRFDNDPQEFVAFASDSGNVDELVKMGLAVKREVSNESGVNADVGAPQGASGAAVKVDGGAAAAK